MNKKFYITTTLPYVNAEPHLGHAMEFIRADAIARYKKLLGFDVFFNTGTDEHGMKLFLGAKKEGKSTQEYVDFYAEKVKDLLKLLEISDDVHFIRTTDERHIIAAKAFWKKVSDNGYIYKKNYKAKYCVGCEEEKTDSELVDGKCPIHLNLEIETIEEENYFFKYSAFSEKLLKFYEKNPTFVIPDFRLNEMRGFVKNGLHDFSISRLKTKMPWGIEVPEDPDHVMYVWFDALVNYVATLGYPNLEGDFKKYWIDGETIQYCGKDNNRFQSAMWQAMLMAADLPNTTHVVVDGFITGEGGVKMSKSLGNVTNPKNLIEEYGAEALRYFLLREVSPFEDSPFTIERFKDAYNAGLANGLGNLTSRIMKMAETNLIDAVIIPKDDIPEDYFDLLEKFDIQGACNVIWKKISELDSLIQNKQPFKLIKTDKEAGEEIIKELVVGLYIIARMLKPILPETSMKIKVCVKTNKSPDTPLFLRKD
ncbi:MAG: methionine--tRNA ligase [Candidatus Paceibacterota bacterium]